MTHCTDTCCQPWKEDYVEVLTLQRSTRRARKDHSCSNCGQTIKAGEVYRYRFELVDGTAYSSTSHLNPYCNEAAEQAEYEAALTGSG